NNPDISGLTRQSMISEDGDEYAITVSPISGGKGFLSITNPGSVDSRGSIYIENDVAGPAIGIYNEERIGLWTGTTVPSYPLQLFGDFYMQSRHIRDINQSPGSDSLSLLGRGDAGMPWKQIAGRNGIAVEGSPSNDTIYIDGSGVSGVSEVVGFNGLSN